MAALCRGGGTRPVSGHEGDVDVYMYVRADGGSRV